MKKIICIIAFLAIITVSAKAQNKLTIVVNGIENIEGNIMTALFNSAETFCTPKALNGKMTQITGKTIEVIFENIADGEYAIAMFQDENNNYTLDLGENHIPTERWGFSNNAIPIAGPPAFETCKFNVSEDTKISITLQK